MPKVPTAQERSRQNMQNPTGLPSNQVANPVGQLGRGLENLGKNLEAIKKAKEKAARQLDTADASSAFGRWQRDVQREYSKKQFGPDEKISDFVEKSFNKFKSDLEKKFKSSFHRELGIIGNTALTGALKISDQYADKQLTNRINKGIDTIISEADLAVKDNPNNLQKEMMSLSEKLGNLLVNLGQSKEKALENLHVQKKRLALAAATSYAQRGDYSNAIGIVSGKYQTSIENGKSVRKFIPGRYASTFSEKERADLVEQFQKDRYTFETQQYVVNERRRKEAERIHREQSEELAFALAQQASKITEASQMIAFEKEIEKLQKLGMVNKDNYSDVHTGIKRAKKTMSTITGIQIADMLYDRSPNEIMNYIYRHSNRLTNEDEIKWLGIARNMRNIRRRYDSTRISSAVEYLKTRLNEKSVLDRYGKGNKKSRLVADAKIKLYQYLDSGNYKSPEEAAYAVIALYPTGGGARQGKLVEGVPGLAQDTNQEILKSQRILMRKRKEGALSRKEYIQKMRLLKERYQMNLEDQKLKELNDTPEKAIQAHELGKEVLIDLKLDSDDWRFYND